MMVVDVQPAGQGSAAGSFAGVGLGVGPFAEQGAVEALRFAVGLGSVGTSTAVSAGRFGHGGRPDPRPVAGAVVGQDAVDLDAHGREPGRGAAPEPGCGVPLLVGMDLAVGQAGVVVDGGVDVAVAQVGSAV